MLTTFILLRSYNLVLTHLLTGINRMIHGVKLSDKCCRRRQGLKMKSIILMYFVLALFSRVKEGIASLTTHPVTSETSIGELAYFNCSTTKTTDEIHWFHYPEPNSERKLVFGFNQFHTVYRGFRMDRVDSSGSWNLVIPSVAIENAGKYECQDDIGRGDKSSANLIVVGPTEFESRIETKYVIGNNNWGIEPSQLILSCSVPYHGSEAPTFAWKKIGEDRAISAGVAHEPLPNKRVRYNLTLNGDAIENGSSYACYARQSKSPMTKCRSGNITVVGNVLDVGVCKCDCCQRSIICLIFIVLPICNALTAGVLWYLYIRHQYEKQQEKSSRFFCKFCNDGVIFVLLMAIPFCIGLLLWYLLVYCREKLANEREERVVEESESPLNSQNIEGQSQALEDNRNELREQKALNRGQNETIASLRKESKQREIRIDGLEKYNEELVKEIEWVKKNDKRKDDIVKQLEGKVKELELHLYPPEIAEYAEKPAVVYTIKTDAATNEGKSIKGLAVLENELFVVHDNSSEIEVYDSATYQLERKLHIPIIEEPFDLTTGKADNCLYIIGLEKKAEGMREPTTIGSLEDESNKIQQNVGDVKEKITSKESDTKRLSAQLSLGSKKGDKAGSANKEKPESLIGRIAANGTLHKPWPKLSGGHKGCISTCESNLIVCLLEKNIINEFSKDGDLIHVVRLSPSAGFTHPLHAIKVTSMHYVVTHGYEKDKLHRICVVDLSGNIVKECKEYKKERFNAPFDFIEDGERSLLVADTGNNRVLLLNSALKYQRKLVELKDKELPMRICFDDTQRRLFVATNKASVKRGYKDGLVLIYNVK